MVTPGCMDKKTQSLSRRKALLFFTLLAILLPAGSALSQDAAPGKNLVYASDILGVDRLFMIVLSVPTGGDAGDQGAFPRLEAATIDRTPLPAKSEQRRYYFRTLKAGEGRQGHARPSEGRNRRAASSGRLTTFGRIRKLKGTQLPRRWPLGEALPELKQGRTITTPKRNWPSFKKRGAGKGKRWIKYTDDQIWAMQPDSTIPPLALGQRHARLSRPRPGHLQDQGVLPVGEGCVASLPGGRSSVRSVTNATRPTTFANGDMTSGAFPDDGFGGGCPYKGKRYGFIAETCQAYCHHMLQVAPDCAEAYIATEDVRYLHKSLVAFSRVAVEWSYLATMTHHRHRNSR